MALRKVFSVMLSILIAFTCLVSLVGCSNEIAPEMGNADVSFTTSVSKALNQSGLTNSDVTENVSDYYWMYYVGLEAPSKNSSGNFDDIGWQKFSDKAATKGLGTIPGLIKGEEYYFGLRGYKNIETQDENSLHQFKDLIWEGFHYTDGTNPSLNSTNFECVKLTSKTQLITVDVYTAGVGRLFFNIEAPAVNGFTNATDKGWYVDGAVKYDYFTYKVTSLDLATDITTNTNLVINSADSADKKYYSSTDSTFYYSDLSDGGTVIPTGTYLLTIWQNSWNTDDEVYQAVSQRKQVVLINIVSGVNTIISGSLDSTSLDVFDYDADADGDKYGMELIFHKSEPDDVTPLEVTVTDKKNKAVSYTSPSNIITVCDGDYVKISWTSDTNFKTVISVNGDYLDLDGATRASTEFGSSIEFYKRKTKSDKAAYVAKTDSIDTAKYINAYGKEGLDYIVTVERLNSDGDAGESVSFTIKGAAAEETTPEVDNTCLTFSSDDEFKLSFAIMQVDEDDIVMCGTDKLQYSTDKTNWSTFTSSVCETAVKSGDKYYVYLRGNEMTSLSVERPTVLSLTSDKDDFKVDCSGNIMSLLDHTKVENNEEITMSDSAFSGLFNSCTSLVSAPSLPATTLSSCCYSGMFQGCTSLVNAPALPATTLAESCYKDMFYGCASLVNAPSLLATTLAESCYDEMFYGCTSLVNAPSLLATTLETACYHRMFKGCTSLVNAPALPATTLAENCYYEMFKGCTSLVNAPALPATTLATKCCREMFSGCTSLVNAPALPATTLAENCYYGMFSGCTSLTSAPSLPATTLATSCYEYMFYNCSSLKITTTPTDHLVINYANITNGQPTVYYCNGMFTGTLNDESIGTPESDKSYYWY